MSGVKLTKTIIEEIAPAARDLFVWDAALKGFGVKVTPTGRRIYLVQYRPKGAGAEYRPTRRFTIGGHGDPWTIEKARGAASDILAKVRLGQDPYLANRQSRDQELAALNAQRRAKAAAQAAERRAQREAFPLIVEEFIERYAKLKNRSYAEAARILKSDDLAAWQQKAISSIRRADVKAVIDLASGQSQGRGRLLFAHLRKFFGWCTENAYLETSPCLGMKGPPNFKARDRWLSDDELKLVWNGCERLGEPFGPLIKMLILTAQRRDEVASMSWSELDLDKAEWTIPGSRAKNGKAHAVDLSPAAVALLRDLAGMERDEIDGSAPEEARERHGFVFTTTGKTPVSGHSKAKRDLDEFIQESSEQGAQSLGLEPPRAPIPAWRVHDLRRTAATGMARLGHPPYVVEAVLNHVSGVRGGLVAVYQHYEHRPERKAALLAWSDHVMELVGAAPALAVGFEAAA